MSCNNINNVEEIEALIQKATENFDKEEEEEESMQEIEYDEKMIKIYRALQNFYDCTLKFGITFHKDDQGQIDIVCHQMLLVSFLDTFCDVVFKRNGIVDTYKMEINQWLENSKVSENIETCFCSQKYKAASISELAHEKEDKRLVAFIIYFQFLEVVKKYDLFIFHKYCQMCLRCFVITFVVFVYYYMKKIDSAGMKLFGPLYIADKTDQLLERMVISECKDCSCLLPMQIPKQ